MPEENRGAATRDRAQFEGRKTIREIFFPRTGGPNLELHMVSGGRGRPLTFFLSPGRMSDVRGALVLLAEPLPAKRRQGDKGHDADKLRPDLKVRGLRVRIPVLQRHKVVTPRLMSASEGGTPHRQRQPAPHAAALPPCRQTPTARPLSTWITRSGCSPACANFGAKRSAAMTHQSTGPESRAAIPAAKQAAAAPSTAPWPPPATSCRQPSARLPPGGRWSR